MTTAQTATSVGYIIAQRQTAYGLADTDDPTPVDVCVSDGLVAAVFYPSKQDVAENDDMLLHTGDGGDDIIYPVYAAEMSPQTARLLADLLIRAAEHVENGAA